jgi:hypothetical protein
MRDFRSLRALAEPPLTPKSALSKSHTALQLSRGDRCGAEVGRRERPLAAHLWSA